MPSSLQAVDDPEGSYPRLPLGFIRLASRTIPCNPLGVRCSPLYHSLANAVRTISKILAAYWKAVDTP